jgi:hypothetical protein
MDTNPVILSVMHHHQNPLDSTYATVTEMFLNELEDVEPPVCKAIYKLKKRF